MMKGKKIIIILATILLLISCTVGGTSNKQEVDIKNKSDKPIEQKILAPKQIVELIVDSFDNRDYAKLKAQYHGDMSDEELNEHIKSLADILSGKLGDYNRVGIQKSTRIYNGVKTVEQGYSYSVKTSDNDYLINIMMMGSSDDDTKVVGFNVVAAQKEEKDFI